MGEVGSKWVLMSCLRDHWYFLYWFVRCGLFLSAKNGVSPQFMSLSSVQSSSIDGWRTKKTLIYAKKY